MEPGYYWLIESDGEKQVVKVKNALHHWPDRDPVLEVWFHGSELEDRIEEFQPGGSSYPCKFYGPIYFPARLRDENFDKTAKDWIKQQVASLLDDPTCDVTINRDMTEVDAVRSATEYVLGSKVSLTISVNGKT